LCVEWELREICRSFQGCGGWLPMALPTLSAVWLDNEWPAAGFRRGVARKGTDRLTT